MQATPLVTPPGQFSRNEEIQFASKRTFRTSRALRDGTNQPALLRTPSHDQTRLGELTLSNQNAGDDLHSVRVSSHSNLPTANRGHDSFLNPSYSSDTSTSSAMPTNDSFADLLAFDTDSIANRLSELRRYL